MTFFFRQGRESVITSLQVTRCFVVRVRGVVVRLRFSFSLFGSFAISGRGNPTLPQATVHIFVACRWRNACCCVHPRVHDRVRISAGIGGGSARVSLCDETPDKSFQKQPTHASSAAIGMCVRSGAWVCSHVDLRPPINTTQNGSLSDCGVLGLLKPQPSFCFPFGCVLVATGCGHCPHDHAPLHPLTRAICALPTVKTSNARWHGRALLHTSSHHAVFGDEGVVAPLSQERNHQCWNVYGLEKIHERRCQHKFYPLLICLPRRLDSHEQRHEVPQRCAQNVQTLQLWFSHHADLRGGTWLHVWNAKSPSV